MDPHTWILLQQKWARERANASSSTREYGTQSDEGLDGAVRKRGLDEEREGLARSAAARRRAMLLCGVLADAPTMVAMRISADG
jgi:hypothetical protein